MVKLTREKQIELLQESYQNATRKGGLIEFTQEIRTDKNNFFGKYSVTFNRIGKLFTENVWSEVATGSGHRKFENQVTHIMIEYKNHGEGVDPGAAQSIFEQVQTHLNILNDEIFHYVVYNWKTEPDYEASVDRWNKLDRRGSSRL